MNNIASLNNNRKKCAPALAQISLYMDIQKVESRKHFWNIKEFHDAKTNNVHEFMT